MANDNLFGAPTKGLGQTVTFAPEQEQGFVPTAPQVNTQLQIGVHGGAVGVGGTGAQALITEGPSPLMQAMMRIGGKFVEGQIEERKTEAFVEGMQRAAAGEAVADIVKETPWWAKMLGSADPAEGARWYAGHTVAQSTVADLDDRMPELRQLPPDQARALISKEAQARLTGDPSTDAAVLQQMSQALPALFKRHTKAHLGYLNEQAVASMTASTMQAGRRLQQVASGQASQEYSKQDLEDARVSFLSAMLPPSPDMDPELLAQVRVRALEHLANSGSLHAFTVLDTPIGDAPSYISTLNPEVQDKLYARMAVAEGKARARFAEQYSEDLARLTVESSAPREGAAAMDLRPTMDKLNADYRRLTGSRSNYFTKEDEAAYLSRSAVAIRHAQERAWDRQQALAEKLRESNKKVEAEQTELASVQQAVASGTLNELRTRLGEKDIDRYLLEIMHAAPDPASREALQLRVFSSGGGSRVLQDGNERSVINSLAGMEQGVMTDAFRGVYEQFSRMAQHNREAAIMAFGKYGRRLDAMDRAVVYGKQPPQQAYFSFVSAEEGRASIPKEQLSKAVKAAANTLNPTWLGFSGELTDSSKDIVMSAIGPDVARYSSTMPVDDAVRLVLKERKDLDGVGKHWMRKAPEQQSLVSFLTSKDSGNGEGGVYEDKVAEIFDGAIKMSLFGDDIRKGIVAEEPRYMTILRLPDRREPGKRPVPQFRISAIAQDYSVRDAALTGTDILGRFQEYKKYGSINVPDAVKQAAPGTLPAAVQARLPKQAR